MKMNKGIKIQIVKNDTKNVAKIILYDNKNRVLFLKRGNHMDKYPKEWDLPGGHIRENESILEGLKREIQEETNITVHEPVFFEKKENIHFFFSKYNSEKVELSHEHVDYKFFEKTKLKSSQKFQKVALEVLHKIEKDAL